MLGGIERGQEKSQKQRKMKHTHTKQKADRAGMLRERGTKRLLLHTANFTADEQHSTTQYNTTQHSTAPHHTTPQLFPS